MNVVKYLLKIFIIGFILIGILLSAGTAMLKGSAHANFFGYKLTSDYVYDEDGFRHIGDAIVIKTAKDYEIHHDTPVAYCSEKDDRIYIYRIVEISTDGKYLAIDPNGTKIALQFKDIIGKVLLNV